MIFEKSQDFRKSHESQFFSKKSTCFEKINFFRKSRVFSKKSTFSKKSNFVMLWHSVRHHKSTADRRTCVKRILRKKLKQIKPTDTPNECIVEEICLPQNPRKHKSDLSAQLLRCCDTQFGTMEAYSAALTVLNPFHAKC